MANMTQHYFKHYFDLEKKVEASRKRGTLNEDFPFQSVEGALSLMAIGCMGDAYEDGYTLTIEHVCKVLNLEERHVKNSVLPQLDYILAPNYAGKFFTTSEDLPFWQRRLLKWKKIFINKDSLTNFLLNNMAVETNVGVPSQDEAGEDIVIIAWVSNPATLDLVEGLINRRITAFRKCSIKEFVLEEKLSRFADKTISDIRYWQGQLPSGDKLEAKKRADEEVALIHKLSADDLDLKAHDKEVNDFIDTHKHSVLVLNLQDKAPVRLYLFTE